MILGYRRAYIAEQLSKRGIAQVAAKDVTEAQAQLIHDLKHQQHRSNMLVSRLRGF